MDQWLGELTAFLEAMRQFPASKWQLGTFFHSNSMVLHSLLTSVGTA